MADHRRVLVSFSLAAMALAACTTEHAGVPVAQRGPLTTSTTQPPSSSTSSPTSVPRPRDLVMSGSRPCDLLTPDQQRRFGIDDQPRTDDDPTLRAQSCYFDSNKQRTTFAISALTSFGIERFQPRKINGEVRPLTVRAFPAVEVFTQTIESIDMFCVVVVDVAAGQAVHVNFREAGLRPHLGRAEVCRRAAEVADVVMGNLLAR
ncbi:DUF3558 domain-containing protein [Kibdelosporangium aridum]|uniref:DUF3558 domain-containing protein n=1 Tax=Kibdelosporangium aridum TaxID=2030 RepID=UPI0035E5E0D0